MGSLNHLNQGQYPPMSDSSEANNLMSFELHKAAKEGNVESLKRAVKKISHEKMIPPSTIYLQFSPLKNTLLHIASDFGREDLVKYLHNKFPDFLNRTNNKGDTALHVAARAGHLKVVKILVNKSSGNANDDVVLLLVINNEGNTPLHEAMIHDREQVVDFFLNSSKLQASTFYVNNKEGKSPLYLAVENGNVKNARSLLGIGSRIDDPNIFHENLKTGKSVIHAAISGKNLVLLQEISNANPALVHFKDEKQQHSLHCAAASGFLEGVNYLLKKFEMDTYAEDTDGLCPLHLASKNGHVEVIEKLLQYYPDAREFLNRKGQNILHGSAENGRDIAVKYILKSPGTKLLLNERDYNGNTPLHLATINWHPKVVSSLTWDKRVNLKLVNNDGLTALEVAETYMEVMAPFRKRLTWMALMSAGAPRAKVQDTATVNRLKAAKYEPYNMEYCKDRVNTLFLVSILIATVTFAAGLTIPGGNDTSKGMSIMLHKLSFQFLLFSTQ